MVGMSQCKRCEAAIRWARSVTGKWMPMDEEPDVAGTYKLKPTPEGLIAHQVHGKKLAHATRVYTCHLDTCPMSGYNIK